MADPTSFLMSMLRRGSQASQTPPANTPPPAIAPPATAPPFNTNLFTSTAASAVAAAAAAGIPASSSKQGAQPQGRVLSAEPEVTYDVDTRLPGEAQPQLEVTPITFVKSDLVLRHWQQIAVNDSYICYGLAKGHIRVLNRLDATRGLIKKHNAPLTQLQFFSRTSDLLASCGSDNLVMVVKCCQTEQEVDAETLMQLKVQAPAGELDNLHICWHPHSSDVLFLAANSTLLLVSVAGVGVAQDAVVCDISDPPRGTSVLPWSNIEPGIVTSDICVTPSGKCLACGLKDGRVVVFALPPFTAPSDFLQAAAATGAIHAVSTPFLAATPIMSLGWIPPGAAAADQGSVLIVGDSPNVTLKLLHVGGYNNVTPLHTLKFTSTSGATQFFNQVTLEPTNGLVLVANTRGTALYAVHVRGEGPSARFDYVAEFSMSEAVLCLACQYSPEAGQEGKGAVNLFAVQPKGIHQYSMDLELCSLGEEEGQEDVSTKAEPAAVPQPDDLTASPDQPVTVASPEVGELVASIIQKAATPASPPRHSSPLLPPSFASADTALSPPPPPTLPSSTSPLPSSPLMQPLPVLLAPNSPAFSQGVSAMSSSPAPPSQDILTTLLPPDVTRSTTPPKVQFSLPEQPPADEPRPQFESPHPSAPPMPSRALSGEAPFGLPTTLPMPMPAATAPLIPTPDLFTAATDLAPPTTTPVTPPPTPATTPAESEQPEPPQPTTIETTTIEPTTIEAAQVVQIDVGEELNLSDSRLPAGPAPEVKVHPVQPAAGPTAELPTAVDLSASATPTEPEVSMPLPSKPEAKEVPKDVCEPSSTVPPVVAPPLPADTTNAVNRSVLQGAGVDQIMKKLAQLEKKLNAAVTNSQQQTTKNIRSELSKQLQQSETTTSAQLARVMQAQMKAIQEERAALLRQHQVDTERLVATVTQSVAVDLPLRIEDIVKSQVVSSLSSLQPLMATAVEKALQQTLPKELAGTAVQSNLEKALSSQLQSALAKPLQDSMRNSFQRQVIPALENACTTMFEQVQNTLTNGFSEHFESHAAVNTQLTESLNKAVAQVTAVSDTLKTEVAEALTRVAAGLEGSARTTQTGMELDAVDPTTQITRLLADKRYNDAFTNVLMLNDIDKVTWVCGQLDASSSNPLSQPVLLSLVQQLGFDLTKEATLKLQWIQSACLAIEPRDPQLVTAIRSVLTQVYGKLQSFSQRATGNEGQMARLAMHVVNSLLHNCP